MATETELAIYGIAFFLLLLIAFFMILRISNKIAAKKICSLNEQQKILEKLVNKFTEMTAENKKEIAGIKKEMEQNEKKIKSFEKGIEAEIKTEEKIAEAAAEKAVAKIGKRN